MNNDAIRILDFSGEAILLSSASDEIIHLNSAARKLFGISEEQCQGQPVSRLFPEYAELQAQKVDKRSQLFVHGADGVKIPVSVKYVEWGENGEKAYFFKNLTRRFFLRESILHKINVVEQLSLIEITNNAELPSAVSTILRSAAKAMGVERVNAWTIDAGFNQIECIGSFGGAQMTGQKLNRQEMPAYFQLLGSREIIITDDVYTDPKTAELVEVYLKPNRIFSMLEVPVRINGDMRGVVCFEKINTHKEWDLFDQKFGMLIAQMVALTISTIEKNNYRIELEKSLKENKILFTEFNHRVKNNLAILYSLIKLQKDKARDEYHVGLFNECLNRLYTTSSLHDMLFRTDGVKTVSLKAFLAAIAQHVFGTLLNEEGKIRLHLELNDVGISSTQATLSGLIVNELLTNCIKHAFPGEKQGNVWVKCHEVNQQVSIEVTDDGEGLRKEKAEEGSLGFGLINDLCEQMNAKVEMKSDKGFSYKFQFPAMG